MAPITRRRGRGSPRQPDSGPDRRVGRCTAVRLKKRWKATEFTGRGAAIGPPDSSGMALSLVAW
jgi:hypothetical protein